MRSALINPTLYFGQPGRALQTLPWPTGGLEKPYERQTFDFLTGSGLHQVSSLAVGSRAYTINWASMHIDTFAKLEQYRVGANGPGPFVLLDPSAPNLLPANVSAPTGVTSLPNPDWLLPTGGVGQGALGQSVDPTKIHRPEGWASLRWVFASTPDASCILAVAPQFRNWYGHPVLAGLPYAFSSWVTVDGTIETNVTMSIRMQWLDKTGVQLSESSGGNTSVTGWTKLTVLATAPANAVYCMPQWVLDGTTMAVGGAVFIDEVMWEQDTVVNTWAVGTGIRPVEIVGLGEVVPFDGRFRTSTTMIVRELAK
jgi:hypothetical protein